MSTNQGDLQNSVRAITGTASDYNSDWLALFDQQGISAGEFNGRFVEWLQGETGSSGTNISGLKQEYAESLGFDRWGSITAIPSNGDGALLLEDGISFLLLEDGISKLLLE